MQKMKIEVTTHGRRLRVRTYFTNPTDEEVFVMDRMHDWYGVLQDPALDWFTNRKAPPPPTALAYVCLGAEGEVVLLSGMGPGPDAGVSPMQPRTPFATRVEPRTHYTNVIELPLPLVEWHAHEPPEREPTRQVTVTRLRYQLEWIRRSAASDLKQVQGWPGIWRAYGSPFETAEGRAELLNPIQLLARTDPFRRFG
jgi:hypothetical protein